LEEDEHTWEMEMETEEMETEMEMEMEMRVIVLRDSPVFLFGFRTGQPLGEFKSQAQLIRGFSGNFGGEISTPFILVNFTPQKLTQTTYNDHE